MDSDEKIGCGVAILCLIIGGLLLLAIYGCTKEYSCEGVDCGGRRDTLVVVDTTPVPISNMIAYYDIYISDNKAVKVIYPEYTGKYHPDTYKIMQAIPLDTARSFRYKDSIDLRKHLPPNEVYNKGDTFLLRMEKRYRNSDIHWSDSTILIY